MSFRSATHATDSTRKGWIAKTAATKALGQKRPVMLDRTSNRSKVVTAWSATFVR